LIILVLEQVNKQIKRQPKAKSRCLILSEYLTKFYSKKTNSQND